MKNPDDKSISSDLSRIATVLKEYFSSVRGPYLANKLPTIQHNYFYFFLNVTHTPINSLTFELVVSEEVKLKISRKPNGKSHGLYSCVQVFGELHKQYPCTNNKSSQEFIFRKAHSSRYAILGIVNTIQTDMDKCLFSCGVFIDLKKAFDTVDHKILLCKLYHYGCRSVLNKWSSSYNTDNSNIASFISEEKIVCLVFHKALAVLGPLPFLFDVNDIQECSDKFFLFADDTNILYADTNLKTF